MSISRQYLPADSAVSLDTVKARGRIDGDDDDAGIQMLIETAALEIEAHCGLALMAQVVTVTRPAWCNRIALPVGPFWGAGVVDHPVTVEVLDDDGIVIPYPISYWIAGGRYPVLHLTASGHGAAIRIVYPAGYGTTADSIPADLQLAIADHAAMLYDARGLTEAPQGLSLAASRIAARHRRIAV